MAPLEPYYSVLLKHAPNPEMIVLKIVKWMIAQKKIDFAGHKKDDKSVAGFSSSYQFWYTR